MVRLGGAERRILGKAVRIEDVGRERIAVGVDAVACTCFDYSMRTGSFARRA
jgi:hypothetical protein